MSASGTAEKMATAAGVQEVARCYLGILLDIATAERFTMPVRPANPHGFWSCGFAVATGPVAWLKIRLLEIGFYNKVGAEEYDDLPLTYEREGKGRAYLHVGKFARSKMFRTVQVVYPIDLVALRVGNWRKK